MEYEIKKMAEVNDVQINQAIEIFIDGFYYLLKFFVKDKKALQVIFKDAFEYEMVYVYIENEIVVGILALGNNKDRPIKVKSALRLYEKLGFKQIKKTTNIFLLILGLGSILQLKLDLKGVNNV